MRTFAIEVHTPAPMIVNQQKKHAVRLSALESFVRDLKRRMRLGRREFNVCLVDDRAIRKLNAAFRGQDRATDVLSFPWAEPESGARRAGQRGSASPRGKEFRGFLGDIVISVPTARRNARSEGHAARREIRWLILHGVLHLLGYDHESDQGEMTALELNLREQLGIAGTSRGR